MSRLDWKDTTAWKIHRHRIGKLTRIGIWLQHKRHEERGTGTLRSLSSVRPLHAVQHYRFQRPPNISLVLSLSLRVMARVFSQNLVRLSSSTLRSTGSAPIPPSSRILSHRNRSNRSGKAKLIEIDLESDGDVEVWGLRKLEDAIHYIIVQRAAPDWLPFIPGSSYWVPPKRRPYNLAELVGVLENRLTDEERLSLTTVRGWPSSQFFIDGMIIVH